MTRRKDSRRVVWLRAGGVWQPAKPGLRSFRRLVAFLRRHRFAAAASRREAVGGSETCAAGGAAARRDGGRSETCRLAVAQPHVHATQSFWTAGHLDPQRAAHTLGCGSRRAAVRRGTAPSLPGRSPREGRSRAQGAPQRSSAPISEAAHVRSNASAAETAAVRVGFRLAGLPCGLRVNEC